MKQIFLMIAVLFTGMTCSKKECMSPPPTLLLEIKNVEGLDLLNPDNSESIQFEDIKVYDIIGDIEVSREVNTISPPTSEDSYKLILNLNTRISQNGISTSVLKYEDYSTDIITARFRRHECGISSTNVWINGEVIIDSSRDLNKGYYTLVKE